MPITPEESAVIEQLRSKGFVVVLVDPSETERIDRDRLASRLRADAADHIEDLLSLEVIVVRRTG
ncbi:hypothetical protein [Pseudomonas sp. 2FE]|uniref:hypothetical protein n=1 Tax=Pseudomonas sp. 2FE TaxID=2502190 RepID=UPI0010F91C43|nr:hypothetical protein [Pseudomonas sp. 2FE]